MLIRIAPDDSLPIFTQIVNGVVLAIARGEVAPGEPLPSVRQLARELLLNPNTVARAYQELEREGYVERRRGVGLFVTAAGRRRAAGFRSRHFQAELKRILEQARQADIPVAELKRTVEEILRELPRRE